MLHSSIIFITEHWPGGGRATSRRPTPECAFKHEHAPECAFKHPHPRPAMFSILEKGLHCNGDICVLPCGLVASRGSFLMPPAGPCRDPPNGTGGFRGLAVELASAAQ